MDLRSLRWGTLGQGAGAVWVGVALVFLYSGLISAVDGVTKLVASTYAPPQLFAFSGLGIAVLSVLAGRLPGQTSDLRTGHPWAMGLRSLATVLGCICFFYAFRLLPLADVFLFVSMMPLFSALMAGPVLGERLRPMGWLAVIGGVVGVLVLQPAWSGDYGLGALAALTGALLGTLSITLARLISVKDKNALVQVFYPNLALGLTMSACLPFVWQPMPAADLAWIAVYGVLLFLARWVLVLALELLPTYTVTPLLNLQFIWMILIGIYAFGEMPSPWVYFGMVLVAGCGGVLVRGQLRESQGARQYEWSDLRSAFGRWMQPDP